MLRLFYAVAVGFGVWAAWSMFSLPAFPIPGTALFGTALSLKLVAVVGCGILAYQRLDS